MLFGLLLTLGVAVLSVALRSYQTSFAQKAGAIGILVSTFLAVYFVSDSWVLALAATLAWFFLPWLEILTRIRALRLPKEKALRPKRPPSSEIFPALEDITREIEAEGFAHVNDAGWDWEDYRQFFRLFYKEEDRAQATIFRQMHPPHNVLHRPGALAAPCSFSLPAVRCRRPRP